jgi:glycerol-3-phosphate O-acyltransferase
VREYFQWRGEIKPDAQRENEYTKILAEKIVERYYKDNIVLSSHLVSFAAFQILQRENAKLDLYGILRLPTDDFVFEKEIMQSVVGQLQATLTDMEQAGKVKLSEQISWPVDDLIADGIKRLGNYHLQKPLKYNKKGEIISESFKLLYFYHNRLGNYDLQGKIKWKKTAVGLAKADF